MHRFRLSKIISSLVRRVTIYKLVEVLETETIEVYMKGSSEQTVVIQTGMTCSFYDWFPIIEKLSLAPQSFPTIAQVGKSELRNHSRTTLQATKELHMLLQEN